MVNKLKIQNYRSIQSVDLEIHPLNAFIGTNSSGKSNILRALNIVLGSTYPTVKAFDDGDFFQRDRNNHILIEVGFSNPLAVNNQVYGFRLTHNGIDVEYIALDAHGAPLLYRNGANVRVSNDMREEVNLMYLDVERLSSQQIRNSQWVLYGKLLKHISSQISVAQQTQFITDLATNYNANIAPHVSNAESILRNYANQQTGLNVSLKLSMIDPSMILKDLRPRIADATGFEVDIEEEGAGIQSSVAIAVARTYADIVHQPLILALEEPELFLHPHACRHFYSILKQISAQNIQVIYTTHERSFVNVADYAIINLVKKSNGISSVNYFRGVVPNFNPIKIASKFDEELNEVFFADKVILVEGPADKIACKLALESLNVHLDMKNISVIDCGSISGIAPLASMLSRFHIPCIALADEDPGNVTTQACHRDIIAVLGQTELLLQCPNLETLFAHPSKFTKEGALRDMPQWFQTNTMQQVYVDLSNKL